MTTRCDSCGDEKIETVEVQRLYVTPEAWDQEGTVREPDDGTEHWCFPCRSHYPHRVIAGD